MPKNWNVYGDMLKSVIAYTISTSVIIWLRGTIFYKNLTSFDLIVDAFSSVKELSTISYIFYSSEVR